MKNKKPIKRSALSNSYWSNNTIVELANLVGAIENQLQRYSHVENLVPASFIKELKAFDKKVQAEMERREM